MTLRLSVRSPSGLLMDGPVFSVLAEDLDGWFGIRPGRTDLVAVLPPGLLVYRDADGEGFVAFGGGLLHHERTECRVMCRDAAVSRSLDDVADLVERHLSSRDRRERARQDVVGELVREALRRLAEEARG